MVWRATGGQRRRLVRPAWEWIGMVGQAGAASWGQGTARKGLVRPGMVGQGEARFAPALAPMIGSGRVRFVMAWKGEPR